MAKKKKYIYTAQIPGIGAIEIGKDNYDMWIEAKRNKDALIELTFDSIDSVTIEGITIDPCGIENVRMFTKEVHEAEMQNMNSAREAQNERKKESIEYNEAVAEYTQRITYSLEKIALEMKKPWYKKIFKK